MTFDKSFARNNTLEDVTFDELSNDSQFFRVIEVSTKKGW